jgi:hypothetical protein
MWLIVGSQSSNRVGLAGQRADARLAAKACVRALSHSIRIELKISWFWQRVEFIVIRHKSVPLGIIVNRRNSEIVVLRITWLRQWRNRIKRLS